MSKTITLTEEEADAVTSILDHALDQGHDTIEGDYLQFLIDGGMDEFKPTIERESELAEILISVVNRIRGAS